MNAPDRSGLVNCSIEARRRKHLPTRKVHGEGLDVCQRAGPGEACAQQFVAREAEGAVAPAPARAIPTRPVQPCRSGQAEDVETDEVRPGPSQPDPIPGNFVGLDRLRTS